MTSLKKLLAKQQIEAMFSTYPVVVWYQSTQRSPHEWNRLREGVYRIQESLDDSGKSKGVLASYQILQTKAALLRVVLQERDNNPLYLAPCRGQVLLCGCPTVEAFQTLLGVLEEEREGFILGGFYDTRPRTYREMEGLRHLGLATYGGLIQSLQAIPARLLLLGQLCDFSYLRLRGDALQSTLLYYREGRRS